MIKNRRQLTVANRKMTEVYDVLASVTEPGERDGLERLCSRLRHEIHEYEAITRKMVSSFRVRSVDDLSEALIKARLYRGWTQKQLGDVLGISEQMIQRDETGGYEKASLVRLADVADALEFQLVGELRPCETVTARETASASSGQVSHYVMMRETGWPVTTIDMGATESQSLEATFSMGGEC